MFSMDLQLNFPSSQRGAQSSISGTPWSCEGSLSTVRTQLSPLVPRPPKHHSVLGRASEEGSGWIL